MEKKILDAARDMIGQSQRVLITTHVNPDGDGIGSELALYHFLSKLGKDVRVINRDDVPEIFAFLPGASEIEIDTVPPADRDLTIILDCGAQERTGLEFSVEDRDQVIVIDHHLTNDQKGGVNMVDAKASATGELVYELLREMEKSGSPAIDHTIALCLYTSIFTDTGSFRYSNTTPRALAIASDLVAYGLDTWMVAEAVYESKPFPVLKLLGIFLTTLGVSQKGRFAWGTLEEDAFEQTGTRPEHTDGFVNYPRSIRGVEVAVLFRELKPQAVKVSMRSKGKVNVAAIAEKFDGGGHHNAAGCVVEGSLDEVRNRVLRILGTFLKDEFLHPA
ncbi:MAG: bifunctional oligoribonuclease/PAP phosphatase NrnA [bacterium]|nr:bifunctional oligoribonuclease/PAP phosphatase NrnA [bacterium]